MRVHNIFDVLRSLLKEYITDEMFTDRNNPRPDPDYTEGEVEWEVERILDKRKIGR